MKIMTFGVKLKFEEPKVKTETEQIAKTWNRTETETESVSGRFAGLYISNCVKLLRLLGLRIIIYI